ncbi:MAG: hypothetical protein V3V23_06285, partial [Dehalococcoidales bacterium]
QRRGGRKERGLVNTILLTGSSLSPNGKPILTSTSAGFRVNTPLYLVAKNVPFFTLPVRLKHLALGLRDPY